MRGEGRHVWDADGRRYLDFFGGILTTITGHAVPEVVEAIQSRPAKLVHTSTLYLSRPMVELAERDRRGLSGLPDAKVFFTTSGTEANEAALLLATSLPPQQPDPRAAQQLPRPLVRHDRDHRQPGVVADEPQRAERQLPVQAATGCAARSAASTTPRSRRARVQDLRDVLATTTSR